MGRQGAASDAVITTTRAELDALIAGRTTAADAVQAGRIAIAGNAAKLAELFALLDAGTRMFEIVEPKRGGV